MGSSAAPLKGAAVSRVCRDQEAERHPDVGVGGPGVARMPATGASRDGGCAGLRRRLTPPGVPGATVSQALADMTAVADKQRPLQGRALCRAVALAKCGVAPNFLFCRQEQNAAIFPAPSGRAGGRFRFRLHQ